MIKISPATQVKLSQETLDFRTAWEKLFKKIARGVGKISYDPWAWPEERYKNKPPSDVTVFVKNQIGSFFTSDEQKRGIVQKRYGEFLQAKPDLKLLLPPWSDLSIPVWGKRNSQWEFGIDAIFPEQLIDRANDKISGIDGVFLSNEEGTNALAIANKMKNYFNPYAASEDSVLSYDDLYRYTDTIKEGKDEWLVDFNHANSIIDFYDRHGLKHDEYYATQRELADKSRKYLQNQQQKKRPFGL
jgi:hypothetical protein